MINITDRSLSSLEQYDLSTDFLLSMVDLLLACDVNTIEITPTYYEKIKGKRDCEFLLQLQDPQDKKYFPQVQKFLWDKIGDLDTMAEIRVSDVHDYRLSQCTEQALRVTGLDQLYQEDVSSAFLFLKALFVSRGKKSLEFSAGNAYGCGTALTMEWLHHKVGNNVVTSIGGVGGYAVFEEVLIGCRQLFRRHPNTNYDKLPQLRKLLADIQGTTVDLCSPVVGEGIFAVETGIHINGILKHPKCYELFPPESVGLQRQFVFGKFSGRHGVSHKLAELGLMIPESLMNEITQRIKHRSEQQDSVLTDRELVEIALEVLTEKLP